MIKVDDFKISYEGEGDRLGLKTAFFRYPGVVEVDLRDYYDRVASFYVVSDCITCELLDNLEGFPSTVEYEVLSEDEELLPYRSGIRYWLSVSERIDLSKMIEYDSDVWIKIRIRDKRLLDHRIGVANWYSSRGFKTMLMPEFSDDIDLGEEMVHHMPRIDKGVRFMPPVQNLLGIP